MMFLGVLMLFPAVFCDFLVEYKPEQAIERRSVNKLGIQTIQKARKHNMGFAAMAERQ